MVRIKRVDRDVRLRTDREQAELARHDLVAAERGSGRAKRYLGRHRAPASGAAGHAPIAAPVDTTDATFSRDVEETRILSCRHDPGRSAQHLFDRLQQSEVANWDRSFL